MAFQFPEAGLQFLRELAENNNKDWFWANKERYERDVRDPARALVTAVNEVLLGIAPAHVSDPDRALNRINRDIRFSKDKAPYATLLWAAFARSDVPRDRTAAFYVGISAESCGVGAGVWMPPKERMAALQTHVAENHERLRTILEEPTFAATFGPLQGEAYQQVPKPWPVDHPAAEWLKLQGGHVRCELGPAMATSPELIPTIAAHFTRLAPLVAFMDQGLARHDGVPGIR